MNYTTNFNLNKPEGTDLYNHLTVDNPNMDTIDAAMQANKLASVGAATELVSGTVHAITRSDSDQNIFKFKATGDFKVGDTITVDGVSVNAYTTDGQQLLNDAYVLSAEVLCILDGTSLWLLVNRTPDASEVAYDAVDSVKDKFDTVDSLISTLTTALGGGRIYFRGTLGSNILTVFNALPSDCIRIYNTSNVPTHRPNNCDYGGYVIFKSNGMGKLLYLSNAAIATSGSVDSSSTSISWHIV